MNFVRSVVNENRGEGEVRSKIDVSCYEVRSMVELL